MTTVVGTCGGSSPRVRGTLQISIRAVEDMRFIPACAGNAPEFVFVLSDLTVHPRVCGERGWPESQLFVEVGSSPRVRGTHPVVAAVELNIRFIPACAGNAQQHSIDELTRSVHPRVCGERAALFIGAK